MQISVLLDNQRTLIYLRYFHSLVIILDGVFYESNVFIRLCKKHEL